MNVRPLLAIAILALAACSTPPTPVTPVSVSSAEPPTSAVYIGNSFFYFNNGLPSHVGQLVASGMPGFRHRSTMITISGSGFDWHDVDSYFRPNAVGNYSFDPNNAVVFNKLDRLFDVAIMMDCSQCPLHPQLKGVFNDYAKRNAATVRKHGARPAYFMSWAYKDQPAMTAQLAAEYTRVGKEHGALVIPAGLAFARSIAQRPELELYAPDKRHPSLAGTYLAACTTYASLFKRSPVGLPYAAGLPVDVARHLQQVAWDTTQEYQRG